MPDKTVANYSVFKQMNDKNKIFGSKRIKTLVSN